MGLALVVLFLITPIAELYVILKVGGAIGVLPTIALLVADSLLGAALWRSQGRAVWRRFNEALAEGRVPHREIVDGVMVIFGGALLLTPGFITDVFGLLLLLPPTRAMLRRSVVGVFVRRLAAGPRVVFWGANHARDAYSAREAGPGPGDIEGSASEVDDSASAGSKPPPRPLNP